LAGVEIAKNHITAVGGNILPVKNAFLMRRFLVGSPGIYGIRVKCALFYEQAVVGGRTDERTNGRTSAFFGLGLYCVEVECCEI
jgi:hypothetical protein